MSFGCSPQPTRFPVQPSVGGMYEQQGQEELFRSSCSVTAARCWLLLPLKPGWWWLFVFKDLNVPSNPLAGCPVVLLQWCYPRWTPMVSSHKLCIMTIWKNKTGLLFSFSVLEKSIWGETEEGVKSSLFLFLSPYLIWFSEWILVLFY